MQTGVVNKVTPQVLLKSKEAPKLLFVCLGNLCRSPMAAAYFCHHVQQHFANQTTNLPNYHIDSRGTHAGHGRLDARTESVLFRQNLPYQSGRKASRITQDDFVQYDFIIALDHSVLEDLQRWCPENAKHKLHLLRAFDANATDLDVPDPYYGPENGFYRVADMIDVATKSLLQEIEAVRLRAVSSEQ